MSDANNQGQNQQRTYSQEQFDSMQEKLDKAVAQAEDFKRQMGRWAAFGDPDSIKGKLEDYDSMKRDKASGDRAEVDKIVNEKVLEERNAWTQKVTGLEEANKSLSSQVRTFKIMEPVTKLARDLFTDDSHELVSHLVSSVADLGEDGNPIIKGSDGKPLRSLLDPAKPMSLSEYMTKLAADKPGIARPKGASGAGSSGTSASASSGGVTVQQYVSMNKEEREKLPVDLQRKLAPEALKIASKAR